jgi:3-oxoacyl-[acyl-carrier-protein] synthase III
MDCFITNTGSFLPGSPVNNDQLESYLGLLPGEELVKDKILKMNGIKSRHYALTKEQAPTHTVYELGVAAAVNCLAEDSAATPVTYLSSGATFTPLMGPGLSTLLHNKLAAEGYLAGSVEINSNSGICTSAAQAFVNAFRAVRSGEHAAALAIGAEQPSLILRSSFIRPEDDRAGHQDIRRTKWFMSVFLRYMLSDGAGCWKLATKPSGMGTIFKVNWTFSRSFAGETPLCMQLESGSLRLTQDVEVLADFLVPCAVRAVSAALEFNNDDLSSYRCVLPHLSSFYFRRAVLGAIDQLVGAGSKVPYWTNLDTAGNTGAASIYILLDQFRRAEALKQGDKLLLFIPESGQFNFVFASLTFVQP